MAAHKTDVISWCWKTPWRRCRSSSLCKRRARSTPRQWRSWRSPAVEFLMLPNTTSSTGNPSGSKTPSPTGQWSKHVRLAQIVFWYRELCNRVVLHISPYVAVQCADCWTKEMTPPAPAVCFGEMKTSTMCCPPTQPQSANSKIPVQCVLVWYALFEVKKRVKFCCLHQPFLCPHDHSDSLYVPWRKTKMGRSLPKQQETERYPAQTGSHSRG